MAGEKIIAVIQNPKFRVHRNYLIGILLILGFGMFRECSNNRNNNDMIKRMANYKTDAKTYKNKYQQVSYNQALMFDNQKQLKSYLSVNDTIRELLKKFKNIQNVITNTERITIVHDTIPFDRIIPCNFEPISVIRDSIHYYFKGTISPSRFILDSLYIPNKQVIVFGEKKTGFLKKEYRVEITNSNPLIQTPNIGGYSYTPKKKWYERPSVAFGLGFGTGFILNSVIGK
jgi:hypothetical protein